MLGLTCLCFLILLFVKSLLTCFRSSSTETIRKEEIIVLPLEPISKYQKLYLESKNKWAQPTPSIINQRPGPSTPSNKCIRCGSVALKQLEPIIHGHNAPEKYYPWQVYVRGKDMSCGGILISQHWVLTAAHCINNTIYVLLGAINLANVTSKQEVRTPSKEIVHEQYVSIYNDIGLIKMNTPVAYTDYIRPACLPQEDIDFLRAKECYVTGWGLTDFDTNKSPQHLQAVRTKLMSQKECYIRWWFARVFVTSGQMCTEIDSSFADTGACLGDSGGPLTCLVDGSYYAVGVVSRVQKECHKTLLPDLFTKVSYYKKWIEQKIIENS